MVKCCSCPFFCVRVFFNGDIVFCCWTYNYVIGNIFEASFENIWFGEKAQKFRESILDGSYKYCLDLKSCAINLSDNNNINIDILEYPRYVELSYNQFCNVKCVMCRDNLICETKKDTENQEKFIEKILDICRNAKVVYLNGEGEALASPHFRKVIKMLSKNYPDILFDIHTNGLLLRKDILENLGIINRLHHVLVSIHAATKKTYEKIVIGSDFNKVLDNIKYLKDKTSMELKFVISSLNYKEMPAFLKLAGKFNAYVTFSLFASYHHYTSLMCRECEKYECFNPKHPEYKKFLKVLKKTVRLGNKNNYNYCFMDANLSKLAKSFEKTSFLREFKNKFFTNKNNA